MAVDEVHPRLGSDVAQKGPPGSGTGDQGFDREFVLKITAHLRKVGPVQFVVETEQIQKAILRVTAEIGTERAADGPQGQAFTGFKDDRCRLPEFDPVNPDGVRAVTQVKGDPGLPLIGGIRHERDLVLPPGGIQGKLFTQPVILPRRSPFHHREVDFSGFSCPGPKRDLITPVLHKGVPALHQLDMPVDAVGGDLDLDGRTAIVTGFLFNLPSHASLF